MESLMKKFILVITVGIVVTLLLFLSLITPDSPSRIKSRHHHIAFTRPHTTPQTTIGSLDDPVYDDESNNYKGHNNNIDNAFDKRKALVKEEEEDANGLNNLNQMFETYDSLSKTDDYYVEQDEKENNKVVGVENTNSAIVKNDEHEDDMKRLIGDVLRESSTKPTKVTEPVVSLYGDHYCQGSLTSDGFTLLSSDCVIRQCLTGKTLGDIPRDTPIHPFTASADASEQETHTQRKESFVKVFDTRAWGHGWDPSNTHLNASGMGATLHWTQELIGTLHVVINDIKKQYRKDLVKILDVPCGDMAWMSRFLKTRNDVDYTGMDIVPTLIKNHKEAYRGFPWKFIEGDILEIEKLESYDIILCRTMLQHLFSNDAYRVLATFSSSSSKYLLTTTFPRSEHNIELSLDRNNPGRFRRLNLEIEPFYLTPPMCLVRDGPPDAYEGWDHFVGLWKLPLTQVYKCNEKKHKIKYPGAPSYLYSCADWGYS